MKDKKCRYTLTEELRRNSFNSRAKAIQERAFSQPLLVNSSAASGGGKKPEPPPPPPLPPSDWVIYIESVNPYLLRAANIFTGEEIPLVTLPPIPYGLIGITAREKPGAPGFIEIALAGRSGDLGADPIILYRAEVPSTITSPITWDSGTTLTPTPTPVGTMVPRSLAYAGDSLYFLYANKSAIEARLGAVNFNSNTVDISTVITGWTLPGTMEFLGESTSTTVLLGSRAGAFTTSSLYYWQAYNPDTSTYTPVYTDLVAPTNLLVAKLSRRPGLSGEHLGIFQGTFVGAPWLIDSFGINVVPQPSLLSTQIVQSAFFAWAPASWSPVLP